MNVEKKKVFMIMPFQDVYMALYARLASTERIYERTMMLTNTRYYFDTKRFASQK